MPLSVPLRHRRAVDVDEVDELFDKVYDAVHRHRLGSLHRPIIIPLIGSTHLPIPIFLSSHLKVEGEGEGEGGRISGWMSREGGAGGLGVGSMRWTILMLGRVMDNYKNVPQYLYSPSQMDMFMTEDNPARRQAKSVTENSISSTNNYLNNGGMWSMSGMDEKGPAKYSMSVSMYRGGARGYRRPRTAPLYLPSLLLDARICYLGMPIVPAVTELLDAQFMWLDYDNPSKPIYLYINLSGTQNEKMESVGSETEAYAIADMMKYVKADVYTMNCGMAYGQAALLLSLGTKGFRAVQLNSSTKLYLPKEQSPESGGRGRGGGRECFRRDVERGRSWGTRGREHEMDYNDVRERYSDRSG
ncbi:hypothetical protein ACLB2K_062975 [Fragaria x ananassa]